MYPFNLASAPRIKIPLIVLLMLFIGSGEAKQTEVVVGTVPFTVELARTPQERQQGLMYRTHLPEGHGMLFIQPAAAPVTFWMKNTYIVLDILYFDANGRLLEVHAAVPPCRATPCPLYSSAKPVKYILEINGGATARLGLKPGNRLRLPPLPKVPLLPQERGS